MKRNSPLVLISIVFLTFLVYMNSINGEFQFDDDVHILEQSKIRSISGYLNPASIMGIVSGSRPVTQFTFSVNYALGGYDVRGYHIFNILCHLCTVILLFLVLSELLAASGLESRKGHVALTAAAIFALHPLQTESVSYIVQRAEVISSFCYLAVMLFFFRYIRSDGLKALLYIVSGIIAFVVGYGAKEIIVTVPVMLIFSTFLFLERDQRRKALIFVSPFILGGLVAAIYGFRMISGNKEVGFFVKGVGQPAYILTQCHVLLTYIRLILLPVNQNIDYDYPLHTRLTDMPVSIGMAFVLSSLLFALSVVFTPRRRLPWIRLSAFGILWFFVSLSLTSSIVPIKDLIFEHRLYLPIAGFILVIVVCLDALLASVSVMTGRELTGLIICIIVVIAGLLSASTISRNNVWRTKISLWQDAAAKSPLKSRPNNNLGNCHLLREEYDSAVRYYRRAIRLDPDNIEAYYNAGLALERLGRNAEAVYYYVNFIAKGKDSFGPLIEEVRRKVGSVEH